MSIGSFLSKAKQSLQQSIQSTSNHRVSFVIGNESADLDSITCALVYGYIQSNTSDAREKGKYVIPITNIPSSELRLRPELKALLQHVHLKPSDLITLDDLGEDLHAKLPKDSTDWTLVDHNVFQGDLGNQYGERVNGVIDHHADEGRLSQIGELRVINKTGSCCSHVVEYCRQAWDEMSKTALEIDVHLAKIALGAILIDTVNLKAEDKVTAHDRTAVEFLESKIAAAPTPDFEYDRDTFFEEINDAKSNLDDLSLEEILRKDYKKWTEGDFVLGVSACVRSISYIKAKSKYGDLVPELIKFAKNQGDQLFAVMTAHNDNGQFERQLLLLTLKEGQPTKVAEKFVESNEEEIELQESNEGLDASKATWYRSWEQKNLTASRKQIAPMIREAMKSS